jgi:hypothetical protein
LSSVSIIPLSLTWMCFDMTKFDLALSRAIMYVVYVKNFQMISYIYLYI